MALPLDLLGPVKRRVGKILLERTMRDGIDLRKLRFLPDSFTLPIKRDGLDPLPALMQAQVDEPVKLLANMFGRGIWLVSGYDEARDVLAGDPAVWSNDLGQFVSQEGRSAEEQIGGLGMTDPPLHTQLRKYLTPEFTMRRLARLQPGIEAIVQTRLDAMEAAGPEVDLVAEFAFAVPFDVICDLLGLPVEDRSRFFDLGVARFDLSEGGAGAFGAAAHTRDFLINAVRQQREQPGDGLIGALLEEYGDELDDVTLGGIADGVFLGGYETSASMLALGTYLIATTPDAGRMLRSDPESVNKVVEELLRHLCVVQLAFLRFAKQDVVVGGVTINEGDAVGVSLLAANRDPRLGPDLDRFDPTREPVRHLSFGWGMHRCVGAELARMELRTALRMLAERYPDLTMAADIGDLDFRKLSAVYGVEALPVSLYGELEETA
ncbi:cytochrome P450 [Nocardioides bizhenqiangii]|uniref:Cytochrome P450 n=1 Tax=Nocardioides bizhenqiangii TaxID=3095076 RepID=A0ABZ0ZRG8_9ACTN|nr:MULTISPECIES: cytochrome P450 [unclassified Nocardioides]MDZ5619470.1 cytochrome P450 [Nocardioides sp. HM23]WQQ26511.1 cytochrome P450 [Nocardioides sp. HM61]